METIFKFIIVIYLIVIIYPYKKIKYDQINVYDLTKKHRKNIRIIEPENIYQDDEIEEEKEVKKQIFCYICNPPSWIDL